MVFTHELVVSEVERVSAANKWDFWYKPTREKFLSKQPKSACGKSSSFQFSFLTAKNAVIKATE